MIYMRGQSRDYAEWATLTGDASWCWDQVLPLFKKSEDFYKGADAFHGAGGELRVEKQRLTWDVLETFKQAAAETDIPSIEDFNRGDNAGCAYFDVNQKRGIRWNASKAFLRTAAKRGNLDIMTGCEVKRLLTTKDADGRLVCTGVEFVGDNQEWRAEADKETLVTAGAIGSPHILQQSGIGPGALLQKHGVAVLHDLPGVGENLQDHLQIRMAFKVTGVKTLNMMTQTWIGKARIGLQYALFQSGPMSMAPSQLGAFAKSNPACDSANLEYHVQPLSLEKFGDPLHAYPAFTASVCNLRPTSRGHVRIGSGDFSAPPKITMNYLATEADRIVAAESIRLTRKIVAAPALQKYKPEEVKPGPQYQSEAELIQAAGEIGTTIFHPVGTCKMGRADDLQAVVDSQLRVLGVGKLRVVDGSVMPTITSGNTNAPIVMIAEKAAVYILAAAAKR